MVHSTDEGEGSSVRSKFTTNTFSVMLYSQENAEANAARIVHCVNLHDELVGALEMCLTWIEDDEAAHGRTFGAGNVARAVLAKARGTE